MSDPDLGSHSFSYDPNGNLVQSVDARGAAGTVFIGYDGLNRPVWHNTQNSASGAYTTFSYDGTAAGNQGVGRLTGETFANGSLSGSYGFTYDARGRVTGQAMTVAGSSFPTAATYDDAGNPLTVTYPDGGSEVLLSVPAYDFGWQEEYQLTEPKRLPKGTRIDCLAHFDNSADNPANPDPTKTVRFGMQTDSEMMCAVLEVLEELPRQAEDGTTSAVRR